MAESSGKSPAANYLWPRFSSLADLKTGKLATAYRRWLSRLGKRYGPAIALLAPDASPAAMAIAVNAILAEMRAQNWIGADAGDLDSSRNYAAAIQAVTMIPAATEFGYAPYVVYWKDQLAERAVHMSGNRTVYEVGYADVWAMANCVDYVESGAKSNAFGDPVKTIIYWDMGDFAFQDASYSFPNGITEAQVPDFEARVSTDWTLSLDSLTSAAVNCKAMSLFVTWFGDDLRAGHCTVQPKAVCGYHPALPDAWSVGGETVIMPPVSETPSGAAAFGGTPSDATVVAAIQDLHTRGAEVSFTPFLLMDIANGNVLPDPYNPGAMQPVYPWRGRITCDPAPGVAGSPDMTAAAATQIAAFVGTAAPGDFTVTDGGVIYTGAAEWTYRRMILYYAHLCALAGGVENFVIGTELRGLVWVRSDRTAHPFVAALVQLAADVKTILPDARVVYAADWTEYGAYQPPDGSGDLLWPLDPLWSSANLDAIGIDAYFPLADWRDGTAHLDYLAGFTSIYDTPYLWANVQGGEGYDWYYASSAARDAQARMPITDGDYDEAWVWRAKDIWSWWDNAHHVRLNGVRQTDSTAWRPQSKPIWYTELGCPAVDKGANQPNVFVDANSSESAYPYYSSHAQDDGMQRRYNHAVLRYFNDADPDFDDAHNPRSDVYDGRMADVAHFFLYTWDARPYPAFPLYSAVWGDAPNWATGHWITGRLG